MKYQTKPIVIEATQWRKNGDHPNDDVFRPFEDTGKIPTEPREDAVVRYFRHPGIDGRSSCDFCDGIMHDHGWIDCGCGGKTVCPGNYVMTRMDGTFQVIEKRLFESTYEPA